MTILYLTSQGSKISVKENVFVIEESDGLTRSLPAETVESVIAFGRIEMTSGCMQALLQRGVPVTFLSTKGAYFGRLGSTAHQNIGRLRNQLRLTGDRDFSLIMAKKFVEAKIRNQQTVLKGYIRSMKVDHSREILQLRRAWENAQRAEKFDALLGIEGNASKHYFAGLSHLVEPKFRFKGRSKRPPKDPFNSLLSFGYTIIMYEFLGVIESQGLSAYAGFMHQDRERHPTLASDMMEEWRAVIVDRVVMSLIQGHEISFDEFTVDEETGAVLIGKSGIRKFLRKLEMKLHTETNYLDRHMAPMTFRRAIGHQAQSMVRAIETEDPNEYKSLIIR